MSKYDEISTLRRIDELLADLPGGAQARIVRWLSDKYLLNEAAGGIRAPETIDVRKNHSGDPTRPGKEESFPQFYSAINPQTDADRALVTSYWLQKRENMESFRAYEVNNLLKDLGHQINNITRAFDHLQSKSPPLIIQIKKSGVSQQARKRYQITGAGVQVIETQLQ